MKLNFKELHVFNGLSRATEAVEDVREMFADAIDNMIEKARKNDTTSK